MEGSAVDRMATTGSPLVRPAQALAMSVPAPTLASACQRKTVAGYLRPVLKPAQRRGGTALVYDCRVGRGEGAARRGRLGAATELQLQTPRRVPQLTLMVSLVNGRLRMMVGFCHVPCGPSGGSLGAGEGEGVARAATVRRKLMAFVGSNGATAMK